MNIKQAVKDGGTIIVRTFADDSHIGFAYYIAERNGEVNDEGLNNKFRVELINHADGAQVLDAVLDFDDEDIGAVVPVYLRGALGAPLQELTVPMREDGLYQFCKMMVEAIEAKRERNGN